MKYITDENYATAKKNGISRHTAYARVYVLNWTVEKAITKKIEARKCKKDFLTDKVKRELKKNGIPEELFVNRLYRGLSVADACKKEYNYNENRAKRYPKEIVDIARSNGIAYDRLTWRVRKGWSLEDASTRKPMTPVEAGKAGRRK